MNLQYTVYNDKPNATPDEHYFTLLTNLFDHIKERILFVSKEDEVLIDIWEDICGMVLLVMQG
jgi:hypothetical protein